MSQRYMSLPEVNNDNHVRKRFQISPEDVKFTQDSVAMCFQNGNDLNTTCEEIAKGVLNVTKFPTIRVRLIEGNYYSVDNRRLYVFRVLNVLGLLPAILVMKVDKFDREFTTANQGCHVRVRSRKDNNNRWQRVFTFRHCNCSKGKTGKLPEWWNETLKCHKVFVNPLPGTQPRNHSSQNYFDNFATSLNKTLDPTSSSSQNHFKSSAKSLPGNVVPTNFTFESDTLIQEKRDRSLRVEDKDDEYQHSIKKISLKKRQNQTQLSVPNRGLPSVSARVLYEFPKAPNLEDTNSHTPTRPTVPKTLTSLVKHSSLSSNSSTSSDEHYQQRRQSREDDQSPPLENSTTNKSFFDRMIHCCFGSCFPH